MINLFQKYTQPLCKFLPITLSPNPRYPINSTYQVIGDFEIYFSCKIILVFSTTSFTAFYIYATDDWFLARSFYLKDDFLKRSNSGAPIIIIITIIKDRISLQ